jgi:hypothetical protein
MSNNRTGQPFDPSPDACGFYAGEIVSRQKGIMEGQKRLYDRMVRWSGKNASVWYAFATLAAELVRCERQVRKDVQVLERIGLIRHEWRAGRRSNTYLFLRHPWFDRYPSTAQSGEQVSVERHTCTAQTDEAGKFERHSDTGQNGMRKFERHWSAT